VTTYMGVLQSDECCYGGLGTVIVWVLYVMCMFVLAMTRASGIREATSSTAGLVLEPGYESNSHSTPREVATFCLVYAFCVCMLWAKLMSKCCNLNFSGLFRCFRAVYV